MCATRVYPFFRLMKQQFMCQANSYFASVQSFGSHSLKNQQILTYFFTQLFNIYLPLL